MMAQPFMPLYYRISLEESLAAITGSKKAARGPRTVIQNYESRLDSKTEEQRSNNENLCTRCVSIGVTSFLDIEPQSELSLGSLLDIHSQQNCEFCAFVIKLVQSQYRGSVDEGFWKDCMVDGEPVECVLRQLFVCDDPVPELQIGDHWGAIIGLRPSLYMTHQRPEHGHKFPSFNLMQPAGNGLNKMHNGRLVPEFIQYDLPTRWLKICEQRHPQHRKQISKLRVIDLEQDCLTSASPGCRYVALSYVWGGKNSLRLTKENCAKFQVPGSLFLGTEAMPRTIADAMKFCKGIQERFLWIDSLCIIQDDDGDKMSQIQQMGDVYTNAVLILAICYGADASSGLPGVHPNRRSPTQHLGKLGGRDIVSYTPDRWTYLQNCVWKTRGWTCQEEELSNRIIYVMESQIHFKCKCGCEFCEEIALEVELATPVASQNVFPRPLWNEKANSFTTYAHLISGFTSRAVSNPEDSVQAFNGIMNLWRRHFHENFDLLGLPSNMMDVALLFKPKNVSTYKINTKTGQRPFPTWCWAGWEGAVEYSSVQNAWERMLSMISWDPDPDRYEQLKQDLEKRLCTTVTQAESCVSSWTRTFEFRPVQELCLVYYEHKKGEGYEGGRLDRPVRYSEMLEATASLVPPHELRFFAPSARFAITGEHTRFNNNTCPCELGKQSTCLLTIFDKDGFAAGAVHIGSQIKSTHIAVEQEFIALSRTTLAQGAEDPSWDDLTKSWLQEVPRDREQTRAGNIRAMEGLSQIMSPTWKKGYFDTKVYDKLKFWPLYNVLLVRREGDFVLRVGIGQIHVDAFDPVATRKHIRLM